jgi:hypothetical protein
MALTNYTIVPEDGVVVVDGQAAQGVSMAGIPANVHAIVWNGLAGSGQIQYKQNPSTGVLPVPGSFTNVNQYVAQTDEAEAIIYAANNPVTYYSTVDENIYAGNVYGLGDAIVIDTPDTPQPPETTLTTPPTPETWETLYWYNSAWTVSSVDPTLSLVNAKAFLITATQTSAGSLAAEQSRIYSAVQLFAAADVSALPTADYAGDTLGVYQTFLDGQVSAKTATINAATTVPQLYDVNPNLFGTP